MKTNRNHRQQPQQNYVQAPVPTMPPGHPQGPPPQQVTFAPGKLGTLFKPALVLGLRGSPGAARYAPAAACPKRPGAGGSEGAPNVFQGV